MVERVVAWLMGAGISDSDLKALSEADRMDLLKEGRREMLKQERAEQARVQAIAQKRWEWDIVNQEKPTSSGGVGI